MPKGEWRIISREKSSPNAMATHKLIAQAIARTILLACFQPLPKFEKIKNKTQSNEHKVNWKESKNWWKLKWKQKHISEFTMKKRAKSIWKKERYRKHSLHNTHAANDGADKFSVWPCFVHVRQRCFLAQLCYHNQVYRSKKKIRRIQGKQDAQRSLYNPQTIKRTQHKR